MTNALRTSLLALAASAALGAAADSASAVPPAPENSPNVVRTQIAVNQAYVDKTRG